MTRVGPSSSLSATRSRHPRLLLAVVLCFVATLLGSGSTDARQQQDPGLQVAPAANNRIYMPMVYGRPAERLPFGFDLRWWYVSPQSLQLTRDAQPRWVRAADIHWSEIEPRPGEYRWELMAQMEQSFRALREAGIEPVVFVQRSPAWAQKYPGHLCSPPAPEHVAAFARFMELLSARYKDGPAAVRYWEIWNEPETHRKYTSDNDGIGCWGEDEPTFHGGDYYGEVVKQAAAAVKRGNPDALVMGGALLYTWPNSEYSARFLEGMLASGGVAAVDILSFHAYGEWGAGDLLINKTNLIRSQLARYGLQDKPLIATEVGASCVPTASQGCDENSYFIKYSQANFAARIYAEAIALKLQGAFWYTLLEQPPGFAYSHLVDIKGDTFALKPAYYAFRNSARVLQDSTYIGPPISDPTLDQIGVVRTLPFRKGNILVYVVWVQRTSCLDCPVLYNMPVPPGTLARCINLLNLETPLLLNCSDTNEDGSIALAVGELPQYIEVLDLPPDTIGVPSSFLAGT